MNVETNKRTIISFLDEEYRQQAANKNYQSIASYVDGMKPTARKVMHTVIKNNLTSWSKVEVLANKTAGETEYLGGSTNIAGVIVTISKGYTTSNNVPMLDTNGNFGQRLDTKPGEARYIKVRKGAETEKYFNKVDNKILIEQEFEETIVEPKFFVPTLPFLLLNGSEGMGSGHAQLILPRKLEDVRNYILTSLNGEEKPSLNPYFNGFNGTISQGVDSSKWVSEGIYNVSKRTIIITELPVGFSLLQYTKKLDILIDKKIIKSYIDESDTKTDTYRFKITVDFKFDLSHDNIINKLHLESKMAENYTSMDENNSVKLFKSASEIMDNYIDIKLQYLQKRKDYLTEKTKQDLLILASKYLFVKNITDGIITVNKMPKVKIAAQIKLIDKIIMVDGTYDYLLKMPIYSLTEEKLKELLAQIKIKKAELQAIMNKDIKDTWREEIQEIKC